MRSIEQAPEMTMDFGMAEFDLNAAFQGAMVDVVTDEELQLDEKIRRMETIITEGTSEIYREFVDFRAMASQMQMMCNHDHALNNAMQGNEKLNGFMSEHSADDGHGHTHDKKTDDDEIDPITGKKKKKKRSSNSHHLRSPRIIEI